ncbi:MAG: ATP-binding domain-containing protein, partial [Myxococcota bacterium]
HTLRCVACRRREQRSCVDCGELGRVMPPRGTLPARIWCETCQGPRDWMPQRLDEETEPCTCGPLAGLQLVNCQYGYAITAHVAQGSEAREVAVHWTPHSHRRSFEDGRAWLYTALTRARDRLTIWR